MSNLKVHAIPSTISSDTRSEQSDRAEETVQLFRQAKATTNPCDIEYLHEQIIRLNMGVARSLAHRYSGRGESAADLEQVAYLGLTKAVQGFDVEQGHNFLSYAVPTITGEIKRHFRDHCWAIRPPRQIQELQRNISIARQEHLQHHNEEPTPEELAEALGESVDVVTEALATRGCFAPQSLDVSVSEDSSTTLGDLIFEENCDLDRTDNNVMLADLVASLEAEDRHIIAMRFYEGRTQEQIARKIGASQMQVSRRLTKLMKSMREQLEPELDLLAS